MVAKPTRFDRMDSSELIRASARDPEAFGALFDRHAVAVQQWLLAQTRDRSVANELVAETFARAWRNARRFRSEGEDSGAAWLFAIARNLMLQHHRRGRVESSARSRLAMQLHAVPHDAFDDTVARLDAERLAPSVRKAFGELTAQQREAIGYRVLGELSYEDIGTRMSSSTITARTRVHRGLAALRACIERGAQP